MTSLLCRTRLPTLQLFEVFERKSREFLGASQHVIFVIGRWELTLMPTAAALQALCAQAVTLAPVKVRNIEFHFDPPLVTRYKAPS